MASNGLGRYAMSVYTLVKLLVLLAATLFIVLSLVFPWYNITTGDEAYRTSEYFQSFYVVSVCSSSIGTCEQRYSVVPFRRGDGRVVVQMVYVFAWALCMMSLLFLAPAFFMKNCCIGPLLAGLFLAVGALFFATTLPYAMENSVEECSSVDQDTICTTFWGASADKSWRPVGGFWLSTVAALVLLGGGCADIMHACLTTPRKRLRVQDLESGSATTYDTFAPSNTGPPSRPPPVPPAELRQEMTAEEGAEDPFVVEFNPEDMEKARRGTKETKSFLQKALSPRANTVAVLEKKRLKRYLKHLELPPLYSQADWLTICAKDGRALQEPQGQLLAHWCAKHGASNQFGVTCSRLLCALAYPVEKIAGIREKILASGAWRALLDLATRGEVRLHRFIPPEQVQFGQELARGSGGKVFLAKWTPSETSKSGGILFLGDQEYAVAVKVCQEGAIPFTSMDEFLFEAGIMSMLSHPHVLPCHGANEHRDQLFVVMPLAQHGSLLSMLSDENGDPLEIVPMEQKERWALEIALAMEYLHKWDIVYRDLKACNILVDSNKRCLLSDFGISRTVDRSNRMTICQGTTAWMAPEMLTGEGDYSQAVDVYSYGILLYELVAQRRPFLDVSSFSLPDKVIEGLRPEVPSDATEPLRSLMESCWATDPRDRPSFKSIAATLKKSDR